MSDTTPPTVKIAAAQELTDLVRYTATTASSDRLVGDASATVAGLQERGWRLVEVEHSYVAGNSYKGLHLLAQHPSGWTAELQFHSAESLAVKNANHGVSEIERDEHQYSFGERAEAHQRMVARCHGSDGCQSPAPAADPPDCGVRGGAGSAGGAAHPELTVSLSGWHPFSGIVNGVVVVGKPGRPEVGPAFSLRFGVELLARVDDAADADGVSRAEWVRRASEERLANRNEPACGGVVDE